MKPDGSGLAQLTFNAVEERAPAWSPDGTRIAYMCKQGTAPPQSDNEICVMNADGTGQTQLTFNTLNDATPTFSPDGQKILFHRGGGGLGTGTHLWVMNLDGTGQTQITFLPGSSQVRELGLREAATVAELRAGLWSRVSGQEIRRFVFLDSK